MNKYTLLLLLFSFSLKGQEIKVNEKKHLTLIFESMIVSGIVSSDDYTFEYNENEPDNMALIKANSVNSEETSLIVKTENGTIFNINVVYGKEIKNIIKIHDSLGFNSGSTKISEKTINDSSDDKSSIKSSLKENDYIIGNTIINDNVNNTFSCLECETMIKKSKGIKRISDENFNIKFQLYNIFYFKNKLYILLSIENNSKLNYNINYIKSYINTNNENKSSSSQYLEINPVSIFNSNKTIYGESNRKYLFIYDQFSIDNNKKVTFELNEKNGERNIFLSIPHYLINNPKKIKL